MKIGINATFLNEKPTGIGVFTKEVTARLCQLNKDSAVFSSISWTDLQKAHIRKTSRVVRGSLRLINNLNRFIYINTVLPLLIKKYNINLLYCPIMEFPLIPLSPLIVTVHDLHPLYFPEQFGMAGKYFKILLKFLPIIADRVIVPSNFVKNELLRVIRINGDLIDVIPLGYNSAMFKPQNDDQKQDFFKRYGIKSPFILFVGSLFPYKNLNTLLNVFSDIKNVIPHTVVIVGKKELSSNPPKGDERIIYLDYVGQEDMPMFYSYADLLVHPSLVEGFGMTILEAMACGTLVVSSNKGALPEVVGDAGLLFDPKDSKSLAELILKVINNEQLRKELIEKGLKHVKGFSWEKTAEGILQSCEKALK